VGTPVPLCLTLARALVVLQSPRLAVKSRQCFTWVTKAQKAVDGVQRGYLPRSYASTTAASADTNDSAVLPT
jgi:hypothetical protein